jgi:hypothetical protein
MRRLGFLLFALTVASTCSPPPDQPGDVTGTSGKYAITGKYAPISIDRVDSLSLDNGKLTIHGSSTTITEDVPAGADPSKPERTWSLTTETDTGKDRALTFTHNETIDELTIDIPKGTADVHYGTLKDEKGNDVLLLAWGELGHCYWGYATITPKAGPG